MNEIWVTQVICVMDKGKIISSTSVPIKQPKMHLAVSMRFNRRALTLFYPTVKP